FPGKGYKSATRFPTGCPVAGTSSPSFPGKGYKSETTLRSWPGGARLVRAVASARRGRALVHGAHRVAALEHRGGALEQPVPFGNGPVERVGEPDDHVEERRDSRGVAKRLARDSRRERRLCIGRRQLVGTKRLLLNEPERGAQTFVDRRRAPVGLDGLPHILTKGIRRDRAVRARSEKALVQVRREACEELALAGAPFGRPTHRIVQRLGERPAEELGPVEERLHDAERLGRSVLAAQNIEPHPIARAAASQRRSPSPIATDTVCSKI